MKEIKNLEDHTWEVKELHVSNGTEIRGDEK
jgi:hypothetical protein